MRGINKTAKNKNNIKNKKPMKKKRKKKVKKKGKLVIAIGLLK